MPLNSFGEVLAPRITGFGFSLLSGLCGEEFPWVLLQVINFSSLSLNWTKELLSWSLGLAVGYWKFGDLASSFIK